MAMEDKIDNNNNGGDEYIFYFNPSDEELIDNYLRRKVMNDLRPDNEIIIYRKIVDVNLYNHNPWKLAEKYHLPAGEKEWYVFTPKYRKYPNSHKPRRATGDGYWMAIGSRSQKRPILRYNGYPIGFKETLFFYQGKPPNRNKTEWVMDEYVLRSGDHINRSSNFMKLDDWVLCRIYKENDEPPSENEQDTVPRTTIWSTLKRHLLNLFFKS